MTGDEIDDAIDAVVRQITRTEPPAGLRARVMGQLSAPGRRAFMTVPRLAAGAAFAVSLVTGFVLTRDPTPADEAPVHTVDVAATPPSGPPSSTRPAATPTPIEIPVARVVVGAPVGRRGPQSAAEDRLVTAMSIDETGAAIAPLKPMPAIEATALISSPVRINELAIRPLEMDPVRVEPLPSTPR